MANAQLKWGPRMTCVQRTLSVCVFVRTYVGTIHVDGNVVVCTACVVVCRSSCYAIACMCRSQVHGLMYVIEICVCLCKWTHTQERMHKHSRTHTHTDTHTQTYTHTHAHAHTHTHTHTHMHLVLMCAFNTTVHYA